LQRLFTTFPSGAPGFGLLLLRLSVAAALLGHGGACLRDPAPTPGACVVGVLTALIAVPVVLGLLTPLSGAAAAAAAAGLALSVLPSPAGDALAAGASAFAVALAAAALAFLGPGAFSVDAALFGRREITIPRYRADS
jgi:putative oxidoreductase